MTPRLLRFAVVALALAGAAPAAAQSIELPARTTPERASRGWTPVRVGKWVLLGAALGFGGYALQNSRRADDAYDQLRDRCHADEALCVTASGRYVDAGSEALYRRSNAADDRARIGIIGGQVSLLGSAALFVYDLRNGTGPGDIPYPTGRRGGRRMVIGARLAF